MVNLADLLGKIAAINPGAKLVAVSKNVTSHSVRELMGQGQVDFGENRVQEMLKKQSELLGAELRWHMIGRLQSNKINQFIATKPFLWQSCDSLERALQVDRRLNFRLDTLVQINSANEQSKQGVSADMARDIYAQIAEQCPNLNLIGVMSIGAHSDEISQVASSFETTYKIYQDLQACGARICSMGMSGDYEIALKSGSNMLRLGSMLYI